MNKNFITKMLQAKQLEYQALKEIMPECMLNRLSKLEDEMLDLGKEILMTVMSRTEEEDDHTASADNSTIRKVTIE